MSSTPRTGRETRSAPDADRRTETAGASGGGEEGPALSRPGTDRPEVALAAPSGRMPYREGLELQRRLARARIGGGLGRDLMLLVEHEPVLTLGRDAGEGHLRAEPRRLEELGVETVEIERGGDVTYHGPGQLVGYPILDLGSYRRDLHWYLRALEEALIRALGELGLPAFRIPDHTGVWVGEERGADPGSRTAGEEDPGPGDERTGGDASVASGIREGRVRKIASIGVHVSRWVTWHGFALNVTDEPMEKFRLIVPCGIRGVRMTSLHGEGVRVKRPRVARAVGAGFASVFDVRTEEVRLADLRVPETGTPEAP